MRYKLEIPLTARIANGLGLRRNPFVAVSAARQPSVLKEVDAHMAMVHVRTTGLSGKRI